MKPESQETNCVLDGNQPSMRLVYIDGWNSARISRKGQEIRDGKK